MTRYIRQRLITAIPVFFGITFLVFLFLNLTPASIIDLMGEGTASNAAERAALEAYLGLDQPFFTRYLYWLWNLLHGDLGTSFAMGRPVTLLLRQRLLPSLILTGTGVLLAVSLALPLGVLAAWRPGSFWDRLATGLSVISFGVPGFFMSLLLIALFAVALGWLPAAGMYTSGGSGSLGDLLWHLALPALVVCMNALGGLVKQTRSACLEVLGEDYITTAWAKGLRARAVAVRHMLRCALMPILTTVLSHIPHIIGGSVVVERVFGWPGMGSLMFSAVASRDYPVVMGVSAAVSLAVLCANLLLDLCYGLADPRVRYAGVKP